MVCRNNILYLFCALIVVSLLIPSAVFAESSNEALLADLSANMMQIPINEGLDYTIDCGPARDVINVEPKSSTSLDGKFYCVMQMGDQTVFGTFTSLTGDSKESSATILNTYKDIAYDAHRKSTEIDEKACAYFNPDLDPLTFQACRNNENKKSAIEGMYTYVYESQDTMFVIISQKEITSFNRNFFDSVTDFFNKLFGNDGQENEVIDSDSSFEYGYFASEFGRNVSAKWSGTKATIIYQGFVTDLSEERPINSQYYRGKNERQILIFSEDMGMDTASSDSSNSIKLWKKYTSGLRLLPVAGIPIAGDVCGDGYVGYDEDCEPNASISEWKFDSCHAYDQAVYQAGELSCISSGENACKFNTTSCVSCRDEDNDGYSSGQGTSGSLKTLSSASLGTIYPYGPFSDDYDDVVTARKNSLNLKHEVISISYDNVFPAGSAAEKQLDLAIEKADKQYAACVALKPTKEVQCKKEAYLNETYFSYPISEGLLYIMDGKVPEELTGGKSLTVTEGATAKLSCDAGVITSYSSIYGITCSGGKAIACNKCTVGSSSCSVLFSNSNCGSDPCKGTKKKGKLDITCSKPAESLQINYNNILKKQKSAGVSPIIRINLGSSASKLPAQSSQYTAAQLDRTRAYCYSLAKGLSGKWAGLEDPASHPKLNTYIVIGDSTNFGMSAASYAAAYYACKQGIEDGQNADATVLYGLPSNPALQSDYLSELDSNNVDGLYVEPAKECTSIEKVVIGGSGTNYVRDETVINIGIPGSACKFSEMTTEQYKERAKALAYTNLSVVALVEIPFDESTNFGTRHMVDLVNLKTKVLINNNKKSFSETISPDEEVITNVTNYWIATMEGLSGSVFSFDKFVSGNAIPDNVVMMFSDDGVKSKLSIHNYGPELKLNKSDLDLKSCGVTEVTYTTQAGIVKDKNFSYVVPANSVTVISLSSESSCLVGNKQGIAACKTAIDCNDSEAPVGRINPGATEWCADNIDNNCNGVIDEAGCSSSEPDPLGAIVCDYNGKCDDPEIGESRTLCSDCVRAGACPKASTVATYGSIKFSTRAGINNEPQLLIESTNPSCGGPIALVFDTTAFAPKTILSTRSTTNCGSSIVGNIVTLETLSGMWRIKKKDNNQLGQNWFVTNSLKSQSTNCWAGLPEQLDIKFDQKPSCIPNGEKGQGESCVVQADCMPGKGLYCTDGKCSQTASADRNAISVALGGSVYSGNCPTDPTNSDRTCFPAGTKILMADGSYKNIEDVVIGDSVASYDENAKMQSTGKVLAFETPIRSHICRIGFTDDSELKLTNDHPLLSAGGWKVIDLSTRKNTKFLSGQLAVGDKVMTSDNDYKEIESINCWSQRVQMYNLEEIEDNHNFYADGVLAHNKCCDDCGSPKKSNEIDPDKDYTTDGSGEWI